MIIVTLLLHYNNLFVILYIVSHLIFFFIENNNINIILDEELPIKVFKVFKTEDDPSLRIIVLKCLEKMVSVPEIWNRSLSKSDLIVSTIYY